jgi:Mrp family chromosome partitioning ATPase
MIVEKSIAMANMLNVPVLGIVENMSYYECSKCGEKEYIFGKSNVDEIASKHGIKLVAKLPIDPKVRKLVDNGKVEEVDTNNLSEILHSIL